MTPDNQVNKKRILFLMMVYDNPLIMGEYHLLLQHYLKVKEKHHLDNIEIYGYTSGNNFNYDEENRLFTFNINHGENYFATYLKTRVMFEYADKHFDFDYVYRANTSTYCNLQLLDKFIQQAEFDEDTICGSELYCRHDIVKKENSVNIDITYKYIRGNSVLIPRNLLKSIYECDMNELMQAKQTLSLVADDDIIGWIATERKINYKTYFQEWFKCINVPGHCFANENVSLEDLRGFIAIQVKHYYGRETEYFNLFTLCNTFEDYEYEERDLEHTLKFYNAPDIIWIDMDFGYIRETPEGFYHVGYGRDAVYNALFNNKKE